MVPWSHLRQPFLGWVMTVLTSELTHFNLVIHLSKAQQSAFRFFSLLRVPLLLRSHVNLVRCILPCDAVRTTRNLFFRCSFSVCDKQHDMYDNRQQACPFPAGVVSLVSGEVKHVVHLIRWNLKAVYALVADWNTGLLWHNRTNSRYRNWVLFLTNCFVFCLASTSSPFGP